MMRRLRFVVGRGIAAGLCAAVMTPAVPAGALRATQEGAGLEELRRAFGPARQAGLEEGPTLLHELERWEAVIRTFTPNSRMFKALNRLYEVVRGAWIRERARGRVSSARWDHVIEVTALMALVSQRAEFPTGLRGLLVVAALLHDHPHSPTDQLWIEEKLWESEAEGGLRHPLKRVLSAGRLVDHASARNLLDHWLAMVRTTPPTLLPDSLAGLPEPEWLLPWGRGQVLQAGELLLRADAVATVITPEVDIAARLPTSWDYPGAPNNIPRGIPASESFSPNSPTAIFARMAPAVEALFQFLVTDDDRSYRETWASRWASFVTRFLRETPEAAREILQKPRGAAQATFKAHWEELHKADALVPHIQQVLASPSGVDDQLQQVTRDRNGVFKVGERKLVGTRERRFAVGPRRAPGLIFLDEQGHVWQAVSWAKDGRWQLWDLADPTSERFLKPEQLASQEAGKRYVVLTASLTGPRAGLEEGDVAPVPGTAPVPLADLELAQRLRASAGRIADALGLNLVVIGPTAFDQVPGLAGAVTALQEGDPRLADHLRTIARHVSDETVHDLVGAALVGDTVFAYANQGDADVRRFVEALQMLDPRFPVERRPPGALGALVHQVLRDLGIPEGVMQEALQDAYRAVGLEEAA